MPGMDSSSLFISVAGAQHLETLGGPFVIGGEADADWQLVSRIELLAP